MPVLDAAAMINVHFAEGVTVPGVRAELRDLESRELAQANIESGTLRVLSPSPESVVTVRKVAHPKLSETDISVLALALELNDIIFTDDYAVQATARKLGIKFKPLMFEGISR